MRRRILAAALLAGAVVGGGAALEGLLGPARPAHTSAGGILSSARYCPHGGGQGWRVWLTLANPADTEAEVAVTTLGTGEPVSSRVQLPSGTMRQVEVPAPEMAAGTLVESFGVEVAAGWVAARPAGAGIAAEPCPGRGARRWFASESTSERGQQAWLVVMNPFAVDAAFDVALARPDEVVRPSGLRGIVLPARRAVALDLNRFALGERAIGVTVDASSGRVAVATVGLGKDRGLRAAIATPSLSRTWLLPGGLDDAPGTLLVLAPDRELPLTASWLGPEGPVDLIRDVSVPTGLTAAFDVGQTGGSLVVASEGRAPFVAGRRVALVTSGDLASTTGSARAGAVWVALPAGPPDGGAAFLILQNPGAAEVRVRLRALTAEGPADLTGLGQTVLPAGRSVAIDLAAPAGGRPVAIVVEALGGTLVAAQASHSEAGYAISLGERRG